MIYLRLFWEFFKTGLFSVGGGLATLPFLYDMAATTGWFDPGMVADMLAISESTPGPIGINMATYAGFHTAGVLGGVVATLGLVTPSIIIIVLIAKFLSKVQDHPLVRGAFYGLRPAVTALIAAAGWGVIKISLFTLDAYALTGSVLSIFNLKRIVLFAVLFVLIWKFKKIHPAAFVGIAAVAGVLFQMAA